MGRSGSVSPRCRASSSPAIAFSKSWSASRITSGPAPSLRPSRIKHDLPHLPFPSSQVPTSSPSPSRPSRCSRVFSSREVHRELSGRSRSCRSTREERKTEGKRWERSRRRSRRALWRNNGQQAHRGLPSPGYMARRERDGVRGLLTRSSSRRQLSVGPARHGLLEGACLGCGNWRVSRHPRSTTAARRRASELRGKRRLTHRSELLRRRSGRESRAATLLLEYRARNKPRAGRGEAK